MTTIEKVNELRDIVSQYETESFAGFFGYFISRRHGELENIELNKFYSKLKDFSYLRGLNALSQKKGDKKYDLN